MGTEVRITVNSANMRAFLQSPAGPVVRTVARLTRRVLTVAKAGAPVDTGAGRAGMRDDVSIEPGRVVGRIYMPEHMWYQQKGTGVYAGRGPIRPTNGRFLVFEAGRLVGPLPRGASAPAPGARPLVFAREVRGVPPNPFLTDAMRAVLPWPVIER